MVGDVKENGSVNTRKNLEVCCMCLISCNICTLPPLVAHKYSPSTFSMIAFCTKEGITSSCRLLFFHD